MKTSKFEQLLERYAKDINSLDGFSNSPIVKSKNIRIDEQDQPNTTTSNKTNLKEYLSNTVKYLDKAFETLSTLKKNKGTLSKEENEQFIKLIESCKKFTGR